MAVRLLCFAGCWFFVRSSAARRISFLVLETPNLSTVGGGVTTGFYIKDLRTKGRVWCFRVRVVRCFRVDQSGKSNPSRTCVVWCFRVDNFFCPHSRFVCKKREKSIAYRRRCGVSALATMHRLQLGFRPRLNRRSATRKDGQPAFHVAEFQRRHDGRNLPQCQAAVAREVLGGVLFVGAVVVCS